MNDVVAVGPNSCYFTNDGYNTQFVRRNLERLLKFPWGSVVYYDHDVGHGQMIVPRGLELNGINVSPDGRYVTCYCMFSLTPVIHTYSGSNDNTL